MIRHYHLTVHIGPTNEIQMEMLMNFATQKASGYSQDELDMYEQYKYDM